MISQRILRLPLGATALLLPVAAEAHPGHELVGQPLLSGMLHPFTGADHLAAMVMVGLWGGMLAGRARWAAPAAFVGAMIVGFGSALAAPGIGLLAGAAEVGIAVSVLLLGCILAFRLRTRLAPLCALTAAFGFAHGFAHGVEAPGGSVADFAAGFVVSTAALHLLGVELARRIPGGWVRLLGAAGAGLGVLLAVG